MLIDKKTGKPYLNIWFGNFYRPAYDDKEFVKRNIAFLRKSGFNSVMLDAKAWEDFKERFEGNGAGQYVAMVKSRKFCTYPGGKSIASYLSDGTPCVTQYRTGKGFQYGFGFSYGYAYGAKSVPHVPPEQKNNELYPLGMMKGNILADILHSAGIGTAEEKSIERAYFEGGEIIINHTSYPYEVDREGEKLYQYPVNETLLIPHSAVLVMPGGKCSS